MSLQFILLLIGVVLLPSMCTTEEYYVTPSSSSDPDCPTGKPCFVLNDYAKNASSWLCGKEDVSLIFLDGVHILSGSLILEVSDTVSLTMAGISSNNNNIIYAYNRIQIVNVSILLLEKMTVTHKTYFTSGMFGKGVLKFTMNKVVLTSYDLFFEDTAEVQLYDSMFNYTNILWLFNDYALKTCEYNFNSPAKLVIQDVKMYDTYFTIAIQFCETVGFIGTMKQVNMTGSGPISFSIPGFFMYFSGHDQHIQIQDSSFLDNCSLGIKSESKTLQNSVLLKNIRFSDNTVGNSVILFLIGLANTTIDSCHFEGNSGYPSFFVAYSVNILFKGNTTFIANTAGKGGAMNLVDSKLYLEQDTSIIFANNSATDVGGAIYYEGLTKLSDYQDFFQSVMLIPQFDECFYQLTFSIDPKQLTGPLLFFINNSADNGGHNIYGTSLKSDCYVNSNAYGKRESYVWQKVFSFDNNSVSSLTPVSSEPKRVCLCAEGKPQCATYSYIIQERNLTSGEKFNLSMVLVGADFGTLTGGAHASLDTLTSTLSRGQDLQLVQSECTEIEYSVHSMKDKELLYIVDHDQTGIFAYMNILNTQYRTGNLKFEDRLKQSISFYRSSNFIRDILINTPIFININIVPCPLGFYLNGTKYPICQCNKTLVENGVYDCTVINGSGQMHRNGNTWVGYSTDIVENKTAVLIHRYCPYNYCKTEDIALSLSNNSVQCASNRNGILCGGCSANHSLAIGSSNCIPCTDFDNLHIQIVLLLAFLAAGIALVFFIKILDLTVSKGTLNGLILYANIIWINQSIYFHCFPGKTMTGLSNFLNVLKVFIAWLNLDLGVETCFFQGLDAYWKTWLQFVFPIYVWSIAIAIIIVCRYSRKATILFGNNTVQVLATLFLLSYVKLLRTIISIFGFAIILEINGVTVPVVVWQADGNLRYLDWPHLILCVAGLLAIFVLWIPYTITLLLVPFLRRFDHCLLYWIIKWKPLFDAYYGPLKDKHHYWIGGTLLARVALAVAVVSATDPSFNLLSVVVASSFLSLLVTHVYKRRLTAFFETSFLLNLVVLNGGLLYTQIEERKIILVSVSVCISFIIFLGIIILHIYYGLKKHRYCNRCRVDRLNGYENVDTLPTQRKLERRVTQTVVEIKDHEYREPLLGSTAKPNESDQL